MTEVVEGCPCKQCTGKGIGWIKHFTAAEVKARDWRLQKEAYARAQYDMQTVGYDFIEYHNPELSEQKVMNTSFW